MSLMLLAIKNPAEFKAVAERPVHRTGMNLKGVLQLVDDFQGVAGRAVKLVDEREDRDASQAAHFKKLQGLTFDTFCSINDHDHGVDSHEYAVSVFREVAMSWCVKQVDAVAAVVEIENR